MLYYSPRWLRNRPVVYLAIALLVSVVVGFTWWGNTLSIKRALNFYPFFLLGYFYHQGLINKRWWSNTKLHAAEIVTRSGADMIIANSKDMRILHRIMDGRDVGTLFLANKDENFYLKDYVEDQE